MYTCYFSKHWQISRTFLKDDELFLQINNLRGDKANLKRSLEAKDKNLKVVQAK